jgi:3-oxoacyl-[acyl-carrier protein] reductase
MDLGLSGLRALVGGGSSGLGGAIATVIAAEGGSVGIAARSRDRLEEQARRISAIAIPADLSSPDGPAAAVAATVEQLGGLDLLVVNSGGPPGGDFATLDDAAWTAAIDGVLWAAIRLIKAALPHLEVSAAPAILIVLSSSVREPIPGLTTSNVLRPGLVGLIKSLTA